MWNMQLLVMRVRAQQQQQQQRQERTWHQRQLLHQMQGLLRWSKMQLLRVKVIAQQQHMTIWQIWMRTHSMGLLFAHSTCQ
jgi:hypothetical protein